MLFMKYGFVAVSGFGKSGSGACVDILKEFKYIDGLDREFRIAKDPSGLVDLECSLVDNWEFVRHNTAIHDFINYCHMLSRDEGLFTKTGKGFSNLLDVDFLNETQKYINKITNFEYHGDTLLQRYNLTVSELFVQKIRSKFHLSNKRPMYFSKPTKSEFLIETNRYIKGVFNNFVKNNNLKIVVLDQAIPPNNISQTIKYFDNPKIIIVDRDPRDIYATMLKERRLLGAEGLQPFSFNKYSSWHKSVREKSQNDINNPYLKENILRLDFESFFVDYEGVLQTIKEFLDVDFPHTGKNTRFRKNTMKEYVGIWKSLPNQSIISSIKEEFSDSCFHD